MSRWAFLFDENCERRTARLLEERYCVEMVVDVLGKGADDLDDILPYAVNDDMIVVTKDVSDFHSIGYDDHAGIVGIEDSRRPAHVYATAIRDMVEDHDHDRDRMRYRIKLDRYI